MTAVAEAPSTAEVDKANETAEEKKARERDFTKFRPSHQELSDFINAHEEFVKAGIEKVSPQQVKAILALRSDFNDTPEQKEAREQRKLELAEEKKQFEGLTPEQIKAEKAARRAERQALSLEAKIAEAREKAANLRAGKSATGEDLAAAVEAQQAAQAAEAPKPKTTLSKGKPAGK